MKSRNDLKTGSPESTPQETKPEWVKLHRPGYFGRRRDQIIGSLNRNYGEGNWTLRWVSPPWPDGLGFLPACIAYYEHAYMDWFFSHPEELDYICSFGECIDNAMTNIQSGLDYSKQEAFSTHIQDIAVRNVLDTFLRKFEGPSDKILVIRSADSEGFKYGPGNIPFYKPEWIEQPSLCPTWANPGSVEDFWQSNKYVFVKK